MTRTTLSELNLKMDVESDAGIRERTTAPRGRSWKHHDCMAIRQKSTPQSRMPNNGTKDKR